MGWGRVAFAVGAAVAFGHSPQAAQAQEEVQLPEIIVTPSGRVAPPARPASSGSATAQTPVYPQYVVTPTGRPESISRVVGTVQIITRDTIERSTAKSVTELLADNAVGFQSEWTRGQTSLNIRGGATEGQGRDFRSQVLVLINGHRAGTANLSKLSIADIDRIEIVRGPSSVVYGSQNMGGVINLIMKTGRSAPGSFLDAATGSWGLAQGKLQHGGRTGGFDYYVGLSGGRQDDYHIGGGKIEENTMWSRRGATGSFGQQINEFNRVDVNMRTDGVYDTGFRGSSSNLFAFDTRTNQTYDVTYTGRLPNGRANWFFQHYGAIDIDDLNNPNPLNIGTTRTSVDHNRRTQYILGTRLQPRVNLWQGNDLLLGWDWEESRLRSDRATVGLPGAAAVRQLPPFDNNQTDNVNAFYFEDAQTLFDRFTIRGGVRRTFGKTTFEPTPFQTATSGGKDYALTTYSAGATYQALDWLSFRLGTSTGFRAPTASDLSPGSTVTFTGNRIFGNPALKPETSKQLEAGTTIAFNPWRIDLAVFENVISDRIVTQTRIGVTPTTTDTINNPGDVVVRGVELQAEADLMRTLHVSRPGPWRWTMFGNGYYNFDMEDKGAPLSANTRNAQRMYRSQAVIGTRFGQTGGPWHDWSIQITGVFRGPMWYDTEENFAAGVEPTTTFIHRKGGFWVFNTRGEVTLYGNTKAYIAVNNIFDLNRHPIFIALDTTPCILNPTRQNGACGNSMPGREFIVGMQSRW
ncbi:MAG: TonB-dependent receptor [Xanthobacteraceae bacterium]|nr:TonB-dependent receptor [Xanthobacteraceae bacterium]